MAIKIRVFLQFLGLLAIAVITLGLSACLDGDDGKDGAPGEPAPPPGVDIGNATQINAEITAVTIASPPVVNFTLTDSNGSAVKNLPANSIDFSFAKLVPGTDGNASAWQSYINEVMQPGMGGTGTQPTILATSEKGTDGVLVENSDGTYRYTYAIDVSNVTTPIAISYQPDLTHRVTFRIQGFAQVINPVYDFRPSDGATSGLFTRAMVKTETCNAACHEQLVKHRSARFNTENCATCHNPGSTDATTVNTLDMAVMFHKIHRGASLPSVVAGGDYCIDHNGLVCFSDVVHPQDIRNCSNCHDENDPETPDAANWYKVPTVEACGSCHDDVNFETGVNHGSGIIADNSRCTACHKPDTTSSLGAYQKHRILTREGAGRYSFNILGIDFAGPGNAPMVTFSVTNPASNDTPYDLANDTTLMGSRLRFYVAWDTVDINNVGSGSSNASPESTDVYVGGVLQAVDNGDFTYSLALATVPATATGSGIVSFEGNVTETIGDIPVTTATQVFAITDDPANPVARRQKVDTARCNNCHDLLTYHSTRNNNVEACVLCHHADAARGGTPSRGPMDIKHFVHRKHAVDDIRYPQRVSNCVACHTDDGYYPVALDSGVLSTSVNRGVVSTDPTDNNRISPNSAVCSVCHSSATAQVHLEQNGGHFDACQESDGTTRARVDFCGPGGDKTGVLVQESCSTCHAKGRIADVAVSHSIN